MYSLSRSQSGGRTRPAIRATATLNSSPSLVSFMLACGSALEPAFGFQVMIVHAWFWLTGLPLTVKEISVGRGALAIASVMQARPPRSGRRTSPKARTSTRLRACGPLVPSRCRPCSRTRRTRSRTEDVFSSGACGPLPWSVATKGKPLRPSPGEPRFPVPNETTLSPQLDGKVEAADAAVDRAPRPGNPSFPGRRPATPVVEDSPSDKTSGDLQPT